MGFVQEDTYVWTGLRCQDFNNCILESLDIYDNGLGSYMTGSCTGNSILNCDFHNNYDPLTNGDAYGNADGLNFENVTNGGSNTVNGCRFWNNSDDGLDVYNNDSFLIVENCWSWNNGYREDGITIGGEGNGYKLGPTTLKSSVVLRTVRNCISFKNRAWGFFDNESNCNMELYNNTSYQNGNADNWSGGFHMNYPGVAYYIINNISYHDLPDATGLGTLTNINHNSWNGGVTLNDADFVSLDTTGVSGPRGPDGELPDLNFLKLEPGSDLIDAGTDVGISYNGKAPDLGAFEFQTAAVDLPAPIYTSSSIENATPSLLEMTYNKTLANIVPATSAFSVSVNSTARSVNTVAISGTKVLLTLASPVLYGNVVKVTYTKPASNPLQTASGGQAESINAQTVSNKVNSLNPVYVSSAIENATPSLLEISFNLTLANIVPATSAFSVSVNSTARSVNTVAISGTKVLLTLASPILYGDVVSITYTQPAANPLQTAAGGKAASISTKSVTNNCIKVSTTSGPPVVVINFPKTIYAGFISEIDATSTYDPNNDPLTVGWTVPDDVSVSTVKSLKTQFLAPVADNSKMVDFQLIVSNGKISSSKDISINVLPYKPELSFVRIINIETRDSHSPDYPANILDGDTKTKWSSNGDNNWLIAKFAEPFKISHFEMAFLEGQNYSSYFDIYASKDHLIWEPILTRVASCSFTGDRQIFDVPALNKNTEYLYIKYVGHGNSLNSWNNISELKIFGSPGKNSISGTGAKRKVILYPNPASDFLNISIEESTLQPDLIRIIDFSGKIVCEKAIKPAIKNVQFPLSLKSGVYYVDLSQGHLTLFAQKLIVKNQ